jgi:hypothetical protein
MKYFITALFFLFASNSFSQNKDQQDTSKPIEIITIINVDSTSMDEIYNRSLLWISDNFKDSKSAIRVSDKIAGLINGHAHYIMEFKPNQNNSNVRLNAFTFKWKIEVKDNKSRFSIYDILYLWNDPLYIYPLTEVVKCPYYGLKGKTKMNEEWALLKEQFKDKMNELMVNYKLAINKSRDNW